MSLTVEQKALRRTGCGGSDVPAIVGADPRRGLLDIYLQKVEGWEVESEPWMEGGVFLEPGVANWYGHRTRTLLTEPGTIRHPKIPIALCTPDRFATRTDGARYDVSIKVPTPWANGFGEAGTDDVPLAYNLQLQWETFIAHARGDLTEREHHLAAPIGGDLLVFHIQEDEELQGMLLEAVQQFWRDYVEPKRPPPLDATPATTNWLARRFPKSAGPLIEADARDEVLALELKEAVEAFELADARKTLVVNRLKERIGEASGLHGAFGSITWRSDKRGRRTFLHPWR